MKIALVILHADPGRGGAEQYTAGLAGALAQRGHEVSLLASSFAQTPAGVETVPIGEPAQGRLRQYQYFLDGLERHLASQAYDVVHAMLPVRRCDVYHPHAGLAVEAIETGHLKHSGFKRMAAGMANRFNRKRNAFAEVERKLLEAMDGPVVLSLSEYVQRTIRRHYDLPEQRMATLFNAVDLRRFDPARDREAGERLREKLGIEALQVMALMIAQDYERKGLRQAIEGMAKPGDAPMKLVVVGKGDTAPYRRLAEKRNIADRVIFAGTTEDPYPYYQAADFFVLPTKHDPCSLVVLEALAMGVPVISTVFNGACEIMTDGVHGRVLGDPGDVGALASAMGEMMDQGTRKAAAEACLGLRPALSFDAHIERLEGIYQTARKSL